MLSDGERWRVDCADNLGWMRGLPAGCCSLAVTSPPYESQRLYGVGFNLEGQAWVDFMIPRVVEMARVTAGLVCVNMSAPLRDHKASPAVEWLVADLTRHHGLVLGPAPYVFFRFGIPGSGGKRYHRRDWEPVYCFCRPEVLPLAWSDNTATGHPPRWAPGGEMSNRLKDGQRVNQWGMNVKADGTLTATSRGGHGDGGPPEELKRRSVKPSHAVAAPADPAPGLFGEAEEAKPALNPLLSGCSTSANRASRRRADGVPEAIDRTRPAKNVLANSGNVVRETYDAEQVRQLLEGFATREVEYGDVIRCLVGGWAMGDSRLAHESEAPFPETLVEFFVRSYAPPGSIVLDPFCGSGTSGAVAVRLGRRFLGCDLRDSQVAIARTRIARETPGLF